MVERIGNFVGRHPRGFDATVAVFWTVLSICGDVIWPIDGYAPGLIVPVLIMGVALYWRRRQPIVVFACHALVVLVITAIDVEGDVPVLLVVGVYALAAWAEDRTRSLAAFAGFVVVAIGTTVIADRSYADDAAGVSLLLAITWIVGDAFRQRRQGRQALVDRAERAEALRDSLAQKAVAEERTRIARELHDVVAHSMSLMVVQAGAARRVAATDQERSVELIQSIEEVGRSSLDEMRRILGVLRGDNEAEIAPQPDLQALEPLAEEFRRAGLPVTIEHRGEPHPLPPSMELSAYRIVQESLTNTLKHADQASVASVALDWRYGALELTVEDDGRPNQRTAQTSNGVGTHKGLVGMRERVAAFQGDFSAEPRLGGGWRVKARLPLPAPVAPENGAPA